MEFKEAEGIKIEPLFVKSTSQAVNALVEKDVTEVTTVDMEKISPEDKAKIEQVMSSIDVTDSQFVLQFGVAAQSQIASFADNILNEVRAKDSGEVGEVLSSLMIRVKDMDVDSLKKGGSGFKMPFFGGLMDNGKKFAAKYQKLGSEIEDITEQLDKARITLLKDISVMDMMFDKNLDYIGNLNLHIAAGSLKLKELRTDVIPAMQLKVNETGDTLEAQRLNDMLQLTDRFEKKIHDLKLSRMIALQTAPQIRLIQNNNQVLVEKIQSSILNTIPLWKNQIVIALSLNRQEKALSMQREVTDTTNMLLSKNSEMLKISSIGVAKENERGIVDIETLKKVNVDLITTIEETLRIQKEGHEKRMVAEQELIAIENELKTKLVSAGR